MYKISVKWGSGWHYFLQKEYTDLSKAQADAEKERKRLIAQPDKWKKGVKPTIIVWKQEISYGIGE